MAPIKKFKQKLPSFSVISSLKFSSCMAAWNTCDITSFRSTGDSKL